MSRRKEKRTPAYSGVSGTAAHTQPCFIPSQLPGAGKLNEGAGAALLATCLRMFRAKEDFFTWKTPWMGAFLPTALAHRFPPGPSFSSYCWHTENTWNTNIPLEKLEWNLFLLFFWHPWSVTVSIELILIKTHSLDEMRWKKITRWTQGTDETGGMGSP